MLAQAETPSHPSPQAAAWGLREILLGLALAVAAGFTFAVLIVTPVAAATGSMNSSPALAASLVATMLFDVALFGSAVVFSVRRYHLSWRALGLGLPSMKRFWPGVATAVAGQVIFQVYAGLVQLIGVDALVPSTNVPEKLFEVRLVLPLAGVATVLVAPLAEETFFRGFVFGGLRRYGFFWAALASGLLFSAAHMSLGGLIPLALVGMLFAWAYQRTGSLWTNVYAHFVFNLVSFIALTAIIQSGGSV